jgi:hypothetical protein
MAMLFDLAASAAHRAHQAVASCAGSLSAQRPRYCHQPNLSLHADASTFHAFGMARQGALRLRLRRR